MTRFAFYGRVSTEDQQDPESSRAWQLARSRALIEPQGGRIVVEYFDIGVSRSLPWQRRAQANALLGGAPSPRPGLQGGRHRRAGPRLLRQPVRPHLPSSVCAPPPPPDQRARARNSNLVSAVNREIEALECLQGRTSSPRSRAARSVSAT